MPKKVLITGVTKGLGKELFNLFAQNNYFTYGVIRDEYKLKELQSRYPNNTKIILADLSADNSIDAIQEAVQDDNIDLLINNAGIGGKSFVIEEVESAELLELFNIHCLGVLRTTKALTKNLTKADRPLILNMSSRFGSITRQSNGHYKDLAASYSYRIAKASQNMLTNCIRAEFKNRIEVISLHPGKMKTAIAQSDADAEASDIALKIFSHYEKGLLQETNGIIELDKEVIEW